MRSDSTALNEKRGASTSPAVQLTQLVKHFGEVHAVAGLDLTVSPGEIVAFLGPNGAGKTTTIDMMMGLSVPTSGSVSIFGADPVAAVRSGRIAAVMQTGGLLKDLTVAETIRLVASLHRNARPVAEVLTRAGLTDLAGRRVEKCSGGEQQRLRFALALVSDPDLLILDEPTTGMDVEARRAFWAAIRHDVAGGRTVIFATHYLDEADAYADRIVLVRHGRIVADGSAAQIKAGAAARTVRADIPDLTDDVLRVIEALPDVSAVEVKGQSISIRTTDSDGVLRYLLNHTCAHDVEVSAHSLEEAFLALTSDSSSGSTHDYR
jgi:ABC-2 type transport system ATP-binding protein